jgi:hypothetical protein
VTIAADALGPTLSGQLAAFPVLTSVLLVFTHLTRGAVEVQLLTRRSCSASMASPCSASCSR